MNSDLYWKVDFVGKDFFFFFLIIMSSLEDNSCSIKGFIYRSYGENVSAD